MASIGLGFTLSANAQQMASGINAGVTELQKLGYAAKRTAQDVAVLRNIEIGRALVGSVRLITSAVSQANSLLSGFVNESVSISEAAQRSNIVFEESAEAIQRFAQSSSAIGLSEKAAIQAATRFGTLFTTIGLADKQAAEYSETLVRLAADLASFSDTSVDDSLTAISSALVGEFEPIRRFGVLLNEATLKQTALQQGLRVTSGVLDPQTKLLASYSQILRQTNKQQGDFERNSALLANQQRVLAAEWNNVRATIGQALQPAYAAIVSSLRDSLPAIRQAGEALAVFIGQLDYGSIISAAVAATTSLGNTFSLLAQFASPLAQNLLPAIGGYLAFINRQVLSAGIVGLARIFSTAAAAALGYAGAAATASAATAALAASLRSILLSTGIGAVVVLLGVAAGAAVDFAAGGQQAGERVQDAVQGAIAPIQQAKAGFDAAALAAANFGVEAARSIKVPKDITANEFAQGSLDEARSAIVDLGRDLGGLDRIPQSIVESFRQISAYAREIDERVLNEGQALQIVEQQSRAVLAQVEAITQAREAEKKATEAVAQAAQKASEEAAKRVREIIDDGLTDPERSRLKYNQDLLSIQQTIVDAEKALAEARKTNDLRAISDAERRLQLVRETAGVAANAARDQKRERDLSALGLDQSLLRPVQTVTDEFKKVRTAFDRGLIDGGQARTALQNLASEGIAIRKEIAAELAKPSQNALTVSDVRTQAGASEFLRLATGRADPAIEQRAQQLAKLEEIRRGLVAVGANPVDILGA